jgi:hypothetical protein
MATLGLRREIEADRARRHRRRKVAAVMRRGVDAVADALLHQGVIGGVELHQVETVALAVHGAQLRRILVGNPAEVERVGRAVILAARRQAREIESRAPGCIGQRPVGREQIDIAERRRLIERSVFEEAGGHGTHSLSCPSPPLGERNMKGREPATDQAPPPYLKESFTLVR